jgi:hypothetical protein
MKKKTQPQEDKVRSTVWMARPVWRMMRVAALDKGVSFAHIMESAAVDWLAANRSDLLAARTMRRPS